MQKKGELIGMFIAMRMDQRMEYLEAFLGYVAFVFAFDFAVCRRMGGRTEGTKKGR
jgi:hypothetical protein